MKIIILSTLILIMYVSVSFAQSELNAYKYVIVPKKYDFLKGEENKYELNSLTKFLFAKKGFTALFENQNYPADLIGNLCLALFADVNNDSSMFTTKLTIELRDCYNKVIFTTIEGKSKEKEYDKAYHEALREAFISIERLDAYSYNSKAIANKPSISQIATLKNVVENVEKVAQSKSIPKNQLKTLVEEVDQPKVIIQKPTPATVPMVNVKQPKKEIKNKKFIAKSYKNDNISFFLVEQNNSLVAYVSESKTDVYQKGEMIGTLLKTSIPNVYRVIWKNEVGENKETTGYFDETGNLKIDVNRDGKIEIIIFEVEK
ncbi:MAG: hypothetical protein L3J08_02185 [Flavobacteriaceae bacterium]|nr:hypothetical protein [Flavobacteriaceae bacterium]